MDIYDNEISANDKYQEANFMTKKINSNRFSALALSTIFSITPTQALTVNAAENSSDIKIGTAYLEAGTNISLAGDAIYGDGQYEITWDIPDIVEFNDAASITLTIRNEDPYPLGEMDNISLSVDEVRVDGVKLDQFLHGQPMYAVAMDHIYSQDEITQIKYTLRGGSFDDLDAEVADNVTVVFTLSGMTDTDTYEPNGYVPYQPYGDINTDGAVDAIDASMILSEYARSATGAAKEFDELQQVLADVDLNGAIDAIDASLVLSYYAYKATGGTTSIIEFLK